MTPGSKGGWVNEWKKGRAAMYYSLSDEERAELDQVCDQWNLGGLSAGEKKR